MTNALLLAQAAAVEFDVSSNIAFAIISVVMIYSALKMVTTGNVVHAALYLVIVLAASAAIFILLGSDFVGATQILVYIGAIIVLFLFGIMLTKAQLGDDDSVAKEQRTMGALVGVLLFVVMAFALVDTFGNDAINFGDPEPIAFTPSTVDASDIPTPVREALFISADAARSKSPRPSSTHSNPRCSAASPARRFSATISRSPMRSSVSTSSHSKQSPCCCWPP